MIFVSSVECSVLRAVHCSGQTEDGDRQIHRNVGEHTHIPVYTRYIKKQHSKNIISRVQNRHETTRIIMEPMDSKIWAERHETPLNTRESLHVQNKVQFSKQEILCSAATQLQPQRLDSFVSNLLRATQHQRHFGRTDLLAN